MLKVNTNFSNMAQDFNNQHWVINSLGNVLDAAWEEQVVLHKQSVTDLDDICRMLNTLSHRLSEEMSLGIQLHQDVSLLMA